MFGLNPIAPHRHDLSLLHTFGAILPDPKGLPVTFSIYDGRPIPNQMELDTRFDPPKPIMPMGCTAESMTFDGGIQDGKLYDPFAFYLSTPPHTLGTGREMRDALKTACNVGFMDAQGQVGNNRVAYFNCYGSGKIDDFDAARIGLWINQEEKRSIIVGTYWYWGLTPDMYLETPTFKTEDGSLHAYLITGWDGDYLEAIPWLGEDSGSKGRFKISRTIYNKLMAQPHTGAFTITKVKGFSPISIGIRAYIDNLVYMIRQLFNV